MKKDKLRTVLVLFLVAIMLLATILPAFADDFVSRGQAVKALEALTKENDKYNLEKIRDLEFKDIDGSREREAIVWAGEMGLVDGVGGAYFSPDRPISREELSLLLYRHMLRADLNIPIIEIYQVFEDEDQISSWAKSSSNTMSVIGVMKAKENFEPKKSISSEELDKILDSYLKLGK